MSSRKLIDLECQIYQGAFSDEKIFEVNTYPPTHEPFIGAASSFHCKDNSFKRLINPIPDKISGWVEARLINKTKIFSDVVIPSGEVISVENNLIKARSIG